MFTLLTSATLDAAFAFLTRQNFSVILPGHLDSAENWQPEHPENYPCCKVVIGTQDPRIISDHYRSAAHVASKYNVHEESLLHMVRVLEQATTIDKFFIDLLAHSHGESTELYALGEAYILRESLKVSM